MMIPVVRFNPVAKYCFKPITNSWEIRKEREKKKEKKTFLSGLEIN